MENKQIDSIVRDNTPRLRSFVRSMVANADDADDIVQDTLYQFLRTITIMDNPIGHVTSWLYTVARNLVINHGRKYRELNDPMMAELSEIMVASDNDNPEVLMLRNMVWEELDKALAALPKEQRQAIEMTEIKGMSVSEAAKLMGVPQNTFLSRKHYGIVAIRKRLKTLYEQLTEPINS